MFSSLSGRIVGVDKLLELSSVYVLYASAYSFGVRVVALFASSSSDAVVVGQDQAWQG